MAGDPVQLVCDNIVGDSLGSLKIVESMFSGICDLSTDFGEIAARIHPLKQRLFDAIVGGAQVEALVSDGRGGTRSASFNRDIELHVNQRGGGIAEVNYAKVAGKLAQVIRGEVAGRGFDENAEPVIRQMQDRSFRLVFCTMPPRRHRLGAAFDMDAFGKALVANVKAKLSWDDRDVFYIERATEEEIRELLRFLMNYGKA